MDFDQWHLTILMIWYFAHVFVVSNWTHISSFLLYDVIGGGAHLLQRLSLSLCFALPAIFFSIHACFAVMCMPMKRVTSWMYLDETGSIPSRDLNVFSPICSHYCKCALPSDGRVLLCTYVELRIVSHPYYVSEISSSHPLSEDRRFIWVVFDWETEPIERLSVIVSMKCHRRMHCLLLCRYDRRVGGFRYSGGT